jgi:hypothetical protein
MRSAAQRKSDAIEKLNSDQDVWVATADDRGIAHLVPLSATITTARLLTTGREWLVRSGRSELAEPVAPFGHADRPCLEAGDRVGRRVVEDADNRRKVVKITRKSIRKPQ